MVGEFSSNSAAKWRNGHGARTDDNMIRDRILASRFLATFPSIAQAKAFR